MCKHSSALQWCVLAAHSITSRLRWPSLIRRSTAVMAAMNAWSWEKMRQRARLAATCKQESAYGEDTVQPQDVDR